MSSIRIRHQLIEQKISLLVHGRVDTVGKSRDVIIITLVPHVVSLESPDVSVVMAKLP